VIGPLDALLAQRDSEVRGPVGDRSAADCGTLIVLADAVV
jgi:hypothetical protein